MGREGRPPFFKRWLPPKVEVVEKAADLKRGSPRERGIDSRLDRMSVAFRRAHPFCRFCAQMDPPRTSLGKVMDHILPRAEFPSLAYEWGNCQTLCERCDGLKQAMEIFARDTNQVANLKLWCDNPDSRPRQFRPGDVK